MKDSWPIIDHSWWQSRLFNPEKLKRLIDALNKKIPRKVVLVGYGVSGTVPVAALAYKSKRKFICFRPKKNRGGGKHYSGSKLYDEPFKYVIIDDLIDTGFTVRKIMKNMPDNATCVGIYLYHDTDGRTEFKGIPVIRV